MRKEFQWPLIYFGSLMTFVVFPWATNEYQEQLRHPGHVRDTARVISLATALVYGWAILALVNSKPLSNSALWTISGISFFFFLFGQLVTIVPPHDWTVSMFSLASGIVCAGTIVALIRNRKHQSEN